MFNWIILLFIVGPAYSCFSKYVPDSLKNDHRYLMQKLSADLNCECGRSSGPSKYPWTVEINRAFASPSCTGSLINDRMILTSANCLINPMQNTKIPKFSADDFTIRIDEKNVSIKSINCHPGAVFTFMISKKVDYDICVIELLHPINGIPICIPSKNWDLVGQKAYNIETDEWIFDNVNCLLKNSRLFCSQPFKKLSQPKAFGDPVMLKSTSNQSILVGMHSHKELIEKAYVDISSNICSEAILSFIQSLSATLGARYCKSQHELALPKRQDYNYKKHPTKSTMWEAISDSRTISKTCQCGLLTDEFVWAVRIFIFKGTNQYEFCGGSIINSKIILTAAHCVADSRTAEVVKQANVEILFRSGLKLRPKWIWLHPDFLKKRDLTADIALLELERPLQFNENIFPACLPKTDEFKSKEIKGEIGIGKLIGKDATVIGFGSPGEKTFPKLSEFAISIKSRGECSPQVIPEDGIICAGKPGGGEPYSEPVQGDSGGPLMISLISNSPQIRVQVGITSAGNYDKKDLNPPIVSYSSIPYYLSFIDFISDKAGGVWCSRPPTGNSTVEN